jgi:hypothetical protein
VTRTGSADYRRGFSSGVDAAEELVADALDTAEAGAASYGAGEEAVRTFADRLRVELGLVHPYGPHHSAPGLASRLPE